MDASLLMWDVHRNIVADALPPERVVVSFHLRGSSDKKSRFWFVLQDGAADVCLVDPDTTSTWPSLVTCARWSTTGWATSSSRTQCAAAIWK
jgi:hypothetical protein